MWKDLVAMNTAATFMKDFDEEIPFWISPQLVNWIIKAAKSYHSCKNINCLY